MRRIPQISRLATGFSKDKLVQARSRIGARLVQAFQFVHSVEIISMVILERAKFMVQEWFKNWFEPPGGEDVDGKQHHRNRSSKETIEGA